MKLLLDTHIFLWYISGDNRLSDDKRDDIRNPENEVYLSIVSIREAIIKYQLGKLPLLNHLKPICLLNVKDTKFQV